MIGRKAATRARPKATASGRPATRKVLCDCRQAPAGSKKHLARFQPKVEAEQRLSILQGSAKAARNAARKFNWKE
jgi:hypothetical protein